MIAVRPAGGSLSTTLSSISLHSAQTVSQFRCYNNTTMTDSGPKFKILKFLKIIICSFIITLLLLFTVASLRTLSLDVNVGLQLARWEKTNNISLDIDQRQREELLANFKGHFSLV